MGFITAYIGIYGGNSGYGTPMPSLIASTLEPTLEASGEVL